MKHLKCFISVVATRFTQPSLFRLFLHTFIAPSFPNFRWTFSKWTPCSKTCGVGSQQRKLKCLHQVAPNDFKETNSCSGPKPTGPTIEICNRYPCPAEWSEGRWSAVSYISSRTLFGHCRAALARTYLNCRH